VPDGLSVCDEETARLLDWTTWLGHWQANPMNGIDQPLAENAAALHNARGDFIAAPI
jgi:hypothetical protein